MKHKLMLIGLSVVAASGAQVNGDAMETALQKNVKRQIEMQKRLLPATAPAVATTSVVAITETAPAVTVIQDGPAEAPAVLSMKDKVSNAWTSVKDATLSFSTSAQNGFVAAKARSIAFGDKSMQLGKDAYGYEGRTGHDGKIIAGTVATLTIAGLSYGAYKVYTSGIYGKTVDRLFGKKVATPIVTEAVTEEASTEVVVVQDPVIKIATPKTTGRTGKIPSIKRRS